MNPEDFKFIQELLEKRSGFALTEDKAYLLEPRLAAVMRKFQLETISALLARLQLKFEEDLVQAVVEAMTCTDTQFFRNPAVFQTIETDILPTLTGPIWSAGCSTGQEPYSLAMLLEEKGLDIPITATDLTKKSLEVASDGLYTNTQVQQGLPLRRLVTHFQQQGEQWNVSEKIKNKIRFKHHNLLDDPTPLGQFQLILCRNILTGLSEEAQNKILNNIDKSLGSQGWLILSPTDNMPLTGYTAHAVGTGIYRKS